MDMDWMIALLASSAGAALVAGIFKLLEVRANHKAGNTRERQAAVAEKIDKNAGTIDTLRSALRVILHDRIKHLARKYISDGAVAYDDRRDLIEMHGIYHGGLSGNGNLDALMEEFKRVPIK